MKYILNPNIALRSWRLVPYAYYMRNMRDARGLKKAEFEFLEKCDGNTEIEDGSPLAKELWEKGFIFPAKTGDTLSRWQKPLFCDNRYFPSINWMITGRCNFNCLHCFNAADNSPCVSEWSLDEARELIRQSRLCGINAFTITGGEPMLHKNFFEIVQSIYDNGMYIYALNTNGFYINQEALDRFKEIGCDPIIKISFDGLGHHDWLRGRTGAQDDALRAIRLCVENGFRVKAQTNVHRLNVNSMLPTVDLLDKMGVCETRIIRTSESPRWKENAGDACLGVTEYYDRMLEFAAEYTKAHRRMSIDIWQFLSLFPDEKAFRVRPVECAEGEYRDSIPVCRGNRGMIAIAANGNVYPCMQLSGTYDARGEFLGNVKTDGLQPLLQGGDYLCEVCTTLKQLSEHNSECADCRYFRYCAGGCRALAFGFTGDKLGCDPSKCEFFKKGYYEKITALLDGWKNLAPIGNEGGL